MIKILFASAVLLAGVVGSADAETMSNGVARAHKPRITANGRCNGTSYGTGARRCGSLSGGPSGGNSSRN